MNKKKILVQIAACLIITAAAACGSRMKNEKISNVYHQIKEQVMYEMTMDDVKAAGKEVSAVLSSAPSKVVSAVTKVNNASKYGETIDEKSDGDIKQVHAAAGGMIIASGRNDQLGLYIKIRHEDAVSVYGNLSDINVVESERVQRGEIIGSYDTLAGKEFYYDLQEKL